MRLICQQKIPRYLLEHKKDTLAFKRNLCENPLTRRGMLSMVSKIYDPLSFAAPFLLKGKRIFQELYNNN